MAVQLCPGTGPGPNQEAPWAAAKRESRWQAWAEVRRPLGGFLGHSFYPARLQVRWDLRLLPAEQPQEGPRAFAGSTAPSRVLPGPAGRSLAACSPNLVILRVNPPSAPILSFPPLQPSFLSSPSPLWLCA